MSIDFLYPFFLILHVLICLFLILLVLVQNDKGGGLAGAFGGMGSNAAFSGASAATLLTKITQWTAIASFVVILLLNALSVKKSGPQGFSSDLEPRKSLSSVIPEGVNSGSAPVGGVPGIQQAPAQSDGENSSAGEAPAASEGATEQAPSIPGLETAPESEE